MSVTRNEAQSQPPTATLAADIAHRCEKARLNADKTSWTARCPAHEDRTPSLSITPKGEKVLLHCHAGCTVEAIVGELGMTTADLSTAPTTRTKSYQRIVAVYDYTDTSGYVVHQTLRFDPKGFSQRRSDPSRPGEYIKNLEGVERVLFRLPQVLAAIKRGESVYIVEGEQDVLTLEKLGLTATTNAMGAGSWRESYSESLQGAACILLPDNDAKGKKHMQEVAASLQGKAKRTTVVELPGLFDKGDVTDWVRAGGDRSQLEALITAAVVSQRKRFNSISARDLYHKQLPPLRYTVGGILPAGATLLVGKAKNGKTRLISDLCLSVASGGMALGRYAVEQGTVLCLLLEDGERRAQARLKEYMGYLGIAEIPENLHFVLWEAPRVGAGLEESIETWLEEHPDTALIVVDILEKIRPRRNKHDSVYTSDYAALSSLQQIGQERNIGVLVVHHANKGKHDDVRDLVSGSEGLPAACDTTWVLKRRAGETDAELHITGREVEECQLDLQLKDGFWSVVDDADLARMSTSRRAIYDLLIATPSTPLPPNQIASRLGKEPSTVRTLLQKMVSSGVLFTPSDGRYAVRPTYGTSPSSEAPEPPDPPSASPPDPDSLSPFHTTTTTHERESERESEKSVDSIDSIDSIDSVDSVDGVRTGVDASMAVYSGGDKRRQLQPVERVGGYGPLSTLSTVSIGVIQKTMHNDVHANGYYDGPPHYPCRGGTRYWRNAADELVCARCHPRPQEGVHD